MCETLSHTLSQAHQKTAPSYCLRQVLETCLKHCKVLPVNAFDMTFDIVFDGNFGIKLEYILNFCLFLVVLSSDIVDLDRAIAGDLWVVQETEDLQKSFNKMVGGLVNDQEDEWVKGPA